MAVEAGRAIGLLSPGDPAILHQQAESQRYKKVLRAWPLNFALTF